MAQVAVIGAGIIGLSSAVAIQQKLPKVKVTIIADKFGRHTTSDGSAGLFAPFAKGTPEDVYHHWASEGAKHFYGLAMSKESGECGVILMSGFELLEEDTYPPFLKYVVTCQKLSPDVMKQFEPFYKYGYMFTTAVIEGPKYLPWMMKRFLANGGTVKEQTVKSFEELSGKYDIVVNCSGLGSMHLTSDPKIHPLRGHLIRVSAPWIKHFYHTTTTVVIPWSESIAVGGVKQPDRTDMAPVGSESHQIWDLARAKVAVLEGAKVIWEWVGLRPERDTVRLELEVIQCKGKPLKVIHNYGHGSFGVSLSWGTGVHVSEIVEQQLSTHARL